MSVIYNKLKQVEQRQAKESQPENSVFKEAELPVDEDIKRQTKEKWSALKRSLVGGAAIFLLAIGSSVGYIYWQGKDPSPKVKRTAAIAYNKKQPVASRALKAVQRVSKGAQPVGNTADNQVRTASLAKNKAAKEMLNAKARRKTSNYKPGNYRKQSPQTYKTIRGSNVPGRPLLTYEEAKINKKASSGTPQFVPTKRFSGPPLLARLTGKASQQKSGKRKLTAGLKSAGKAPVKKTSRVASPSYKAAGATSLKTPASVSDRAKTSVLSKKKSSKAETIARQKTTVAAQKKNSKAAVTANNGRKITSAAKKKSPVVKRTSAETATKINKRPTRLAKKSIKAKPVAADGKKTLVSRSRQKVAAKANKRSGDGLKPQKAKAAKVKKVKQKKLSKLQLAEKLYKEGKIEKAIKAYKKVIKKDPKLVEAYNNLGVIYTKKAFFVAARKNFETAIRTNPYYAEAHFNLAVLLEKLGDNKRAMTHYLKFVEYAQPKHQKIVRQVKNHVSFD